MNSRADHLFSFFTPGAIARSAAGLAAFAIRHPVLFLRLLRDGFRDRKAFVLLLRLPVDLRTICLSPLFDREWYVANHSDADGSGMSPELHYLLHGAASGWRPSPAFSGAVYLDLNPEVRASGLNPLVHYEQYGRFIDCPTSVEDDRPPEPVFPVGSRALEIDFGETPCAHARTAVFATFSRDGRIEERDLFYLRGLREACDNVVAVFNSPILPGEEGKLEGIASAAVFRYHGGYDFGSWRIGMRLARERGWLEPSVCGELVFANGSCYAPVRPFSEMFHAMKRRRADFWGVTFSTQRTEAPHLQSFFLAFRRPILDAGALEAFFAERPERATRREAIDLYELQLTAFLRGRGFVPDAFVRPLFPNLHGFNPTTRPLDLIRRHNVPLVKVKAMHGQSIHAAERILSLIRRINPPLAEIIERDLRQRSPSFGSGSTA